MLILEIQPISAQVRARVRRGARSRSEWAEGNARCNGARRTSVAQAPEALALDCTGLGCADEGQVSAIWTSCAPLSWIWKRVCNTGGLATKELSIPLARSSNGVRGRKVSSHGWCVCVLTTCRERGSRRARTKLLYGRVREMQARAAPERVCCVGGGGKATH